MYKLNKNIYLSEITAFFYFIKKKKIHPKDKINYRHS